MVLPELGGETYSEWTLRSLLLSRSGRIINYIGFILGIQPPKSVANWFEFCRVLQVVPFKEPRFMSKSATSGEDVRLASEQTEMHWPRETERGIFPSSGREGGASKRASTQPSHSTSLFACLGATATARDRERSVGASGAPFRHPPPPQRSAISHASGYPTDCRASFAYLLACIFIDLVRSDE